MSDLKSLCIWTPTLVNLPPMTNLIFGLLHLGLEETSERAQKIEATVNASLVSRYFRSRESLVFAGVIKVQVIVIEGEVRHLARILFL